ncbi:peroxiredoxin family protein [Brevifollis gellanilyticus]|nr:TlpA disulfide reductase family protein [Brevifollis gellanilyticus]
MKRFSTLFAALALLTGIHAQEPKQAAGQVPQELMQRLFNPGSTEQELTDAIKEANKAGVPRQQLIEAKLIWGLRTQNTAWLGKILPELEVLAGNFDSAQSAGIKSADDIRSFVEYIKGLQAQEKKDDAGFKKHMQEAFWLAPSQAQLYAQTIDKLRRESKMATTKIDLQLVLATSNGETTTLQDQMAGKKAVLIDFWASWCGPCMQLMPELKKKAEHLKKHGIVVAGMNKDDEKAEMVAEKVRGEQGIEFPWLIEPTDRPFTKMLEIDSIPRMILIGPDGKVLYNGHPQDPGLWSALKKIDPEIKEPEA